MNGTMTEVLAGVDIGGTSVKVLVCDARGRKVCLQKSSTLPAYLGTDGKTPDTGPQRRFDGEKLWLITAQTIARAMKELPQGCRLRSIAVSSCGCTVLLLDEKGEQIDFSVSPGELAREAAYYAGCFTNQEFCARTGYPLEENNSGFHISAFCQREQGRRIAHVVSVDDYIAYRLSGEITRNYSTALSCGMWDWGERGWLSRFLMRTGLLEEQLGAPLESGTPIGPVCQTALEEACLPDGVLVCTGGHDYECAAFACHPLVEGNLFSITGTIDMLAFFQRGELPEPMEECRHICDRHVMPGEHSSMIETLGAVQTEWLKNRVVADEQFGFALGWDDYFSRLAGRYGADFRSTELFLPRVFGTYFPWVDRDSLGMYAGLSKDTDASALLLATVEGMAFQTKKMAHVLKGDFSAQDAVVMVGGGSKAPTWLQVKADILGSRLIIPALPEASATGAALLGGVGCKVFAGHREAAQACEGAIRQEVLPDPRRSAYFGEVYREVYLPLERTMNEFDKKRLQINQRYER